MHTFWKKYVYWQKSPGLVYLIIFYEFFLNSSIRIRSDLLQSDYPDPSLFQDCHQIDSIYRYLSYF
jgi:hypothetical protein